MKKLNVAFGRQNQKIALLLDNASVHKIRIPLNNIKLIFLLANTTSKLQALDAGITNNFKAHFQAQQYDCALCLYISKKLDNPNVYKMDQAQAMFFLANAWLKPIESPTSALPLEEDITSELNGMLPDLPRKFDNKITDVSQLNLEADESEMIVCYTTGTTNDEETAEGNIDETEEIGNTEQDEQCVDIVEFPWTILIVNYTAELNKSKDTSHSYIVDLSDGIWKDHMKQENFEKTSTCYDNALNEPLPDYLKEILCKLDKKYCSSDIYDEFSTITVHPVKDPQVFWLKQAVIDYVLLFMDQNDATLKMPSTEQGLLEDIFGFIKKSKRLTETTCVTGNENLASSQHRNSMRTIGSIYQEERKTSGEHADLCFYCGSNELACLELGLADSGSHGTKELNEVGIKVPRMMKNFALQISRQYGINMSGIKIVGFMISGLNLTALLMTFRGSTSLITRSKRLRLPETVADIPRLLPFVLKLVFNAAQIVKGTMNTIKEASNFVCLDNDNDLLFFPPCYVSSNKRKTPEDY
ncbi:hypothetical protein G6F55_004757 [Rhizopus delemar]|uniref:DDE-1 domain-containing protein n=2 Tax=Rhizopus TaxID=4842 RepID=A0A9P7CNW0_9FUNG|nr:hypothetical protein G6F55_004757 [Rhizopus delemar]KAG1544042.1 hypothetical protein G6F51_006311 [Rhizopus arrhizus]KAG1569992.1 hypothetical protein G6F50_005883 [Rhizopus delemar]KAG1629911.1 hypothetical protein G6F45_005877 [Rhizopus arrhizus]